MNIVAIADTQDSTTKSSVLQETCWSWPVIDPLMKHKTFVDGCKVIQRLLLERHRELFDDYWDLCLELGRLPENTGFEFSERIRAICGSYAISIP